MSLLEVGLSLVCGLIIVFQCAALASVLRAYALPVEVRLVWIAAIVLIPILSAIAWRRVTPELLRPLASPQEPRR